MRMKERCIKTKMTTSDAKTLMLTGQDWVVVNPVKFDFSGRF